MGWIARCRSFALVATAVLCGWIAPGAAGAQAEAGAEPGTTAEPGTEAEVEAEVEADAVTAGGAPTGPSPRDQTDSPILTVPNARRSDTDVRTYEHDPPPDHETPPRALRGPPPRSLGVRYTDALAGSWAGTGLMVLGGAVTSITFGLAVGCSFGGGFGCAAGALYGSMGGGALGWFLGPGIGTARGAGLEPGEAFVAWALGVLSNGAVIAIAAGIGAGVDSGRGSGSSGLAFGIGAGTGLGGLVQVFLTPLYAVTMYEDRPEATPSIAAQPIPFAAPVDDGFIAGVGGAF